MYLVMASDADESLLICYAVVQAHEHPDDLGFGHIVKGRVTDRTGNIVLFVIFQDRLAHMESVSTDMADYTTEGLGCHGLEPHGSITFWFLDSFLTHWHCYFF